jgi:hypothetical protein
MAAGPQRDLVRATAQQETGPQGEAPVKRDPILFRYSLYVHDEARALAHRSSSANVPPVAGASHTLTGLRPTAAPPAEMPRHLAITTTQNDACAGIPFAPQEAARNEAAAPSKSRRDPCQALAVCSRQSAR